MKNMTEIRWHGRGGQGAKTASLLLADAAFLSGKFVQSFPEYGPERSGAPITAYNRISDERCTIHSNIYEPDYVVVVDETLLETVDVTAGLKEEGAIVINSERPAAILTSTKRSCRALSTGASSARRAPIIWGFTPRKIRSHCSATSRLPAA